ncbi:MAG: hypothetical protein MRY79_03335, partial [Alphaproteobacteria bacterium]|nr:hypothetical protein [Alphaproteobacteria bacterium]
MSDTNNKNLSHVNLANRRAIIWDFDGVFYDFDQVPEGAPSFYDLCDEANAVTMCRLLKGLDYEEARRLARSSFDTYNDPVTGLLPLAKEYGYSEEDFTRETYYGFNDMLSQLVEKHCPDLFKPCVQTIRAFLGGAGYVRHGILTHSCRHRWAKPVLNMMRKTDFFDPDHVMGFEDFDFKPKGQGVEGLNELLGRLNARADQTIFVEDTLGHLQVAKAAY